MPGHGSQLNTKALTWLIKQILYIGMIQSKDNSKILPCRKNILGNLSKELSLLLQSGIAVDNEVQNIKSLSHTHFHLLEVKILFF